MFLKLIVTSLMVFGIGCGKLQNALDGAEKIPERMKETNKNLEKTSEGIRLQALNEAQKNMLSPEIRSQLYPVPTGLMASAAKFGEYALPEELVSITSLWLTRIDKIERLPKFDINGNEAPMTPEEQYEDLVERYQVLQALSAIAGQAPQYKVEAIAALYIQTPSQYYRDAALNFIMLRAYFIRGVLIGERHLSHSLTGSGEALKAVEAQKNVDWILEQPFVSSLFVKTRGLKVPANYTKIQNLDLSMTLAGNKPNTDLKLWLVEPWSSLVVELEQVLKITARKDTGNPEQDLANYQKELQDVATALEDAKAGSKKWTETLK